MTDQQARDLAKQIVKDNHAARVKFGRTNGRVVLHVRVLDARDPRRSAVTVYDAVDWEHSPLNARVKRNEREAAAQPTEALMASNGTKGTR